MNLQPKSKSSSACLIYRVLLLPSPPRFQFLHASHSPSHNIRSRNIVSWRIGLLFRDGEHETGLKPPRRRRRHRIASNIPRSNLGETRKSSRGKLEVSCCISRGKIRIITCIFQLPSPTSTSFSSFIVRICPLVGFKESLCLGPFFQLYLVTNSG